MEVVIVEVVAPLGLWAAGHMRFHSLLDGKPDMFSPVFVEQLSPPELCNITLTEVKLQLLNENAFQSIFEVFLIMKNKM